MDPVECRGARTGVVVVHGIGVQEPGSTKDVYGGAIARMWSEFGPRAPSYRTERCALDHIHLQEEHGASSSALIDEAHWDDVVEEPPTTGQLLSWLIAVSPWVVLYTVTRPPRLHWRRGYPFERLWRLLYAYSFYPARLVLAVPISALLQSLAVAVTLFGGLIARFRVAAGVQRVAALTLGDALTFSRAHPVSDAMVDRVVERVRAIASHCDRLVVVAHSQGGAVTLEATQRDDWPSLPCTVITLGSGHKRLHLLRGMTRTRRRRVMTLGFAVAIWLTGFLLSLALYTSGSQDVRDQAAAVALILAVPVGVITYILYRLTTMWIARRVRGHRLEWMDIWASHDLVPDGPIGSGKIRSVRVENARSVSIDHVTYHRNPSEVISVVLDQVDPTRLAGDTALLEQIRVQRRRRPRPGSWIRRTLLPILTMGVWFPPIRREEDVSDADLADEFAGRLNVEDRPSEEPRR